MGECISSTVGGSVIGSIQTLSIRGRTEVGAGQLPSEPCFPQTPLQCCFDSTDAGFEPAETHGALQRPGICSREEEELGGGEGCFERV